MFEFHTFTKLVRNGINRYISLSFSQFLFENNIKVSVVNPFSAKRYIRVENKCKRKAKICKMGMSTVRRMLYLCALSAKKYNRACRELYDRLVQQGKSKKLALIAIANKLLKQAFAIIKNKSVYVDNFFQQKFAY